MKVRHLLLAIAVGSSVASFAGAQEILTGEEKDACEAILCLSSGKRPDQCTPPIRRYFSIKHRKIEDTLRARKDFLDLCPKGGDPQMNVLVQAIVDGAGACDAAALNVSLRRYSSDRYSTKSYILNKMPDYCVVYYTHPYTDLAALLPVYAGDQWVEPTEYEVAIADYKRRMAAAAKRAASSCSRGC